MPNSKGNLWPGFQGHNIIWHWISQKRHEIEPYLLQNVNRKLYALLSNGDISNDLDGPLAQPGIFEVNYLKNGAS